MWEEARRINHKGTKGTKKTEEKSGFENQTLCVVFTLLCALRAFVVDPLRQ
jgi:hypothetical protein